MIIFNMVKCEMDHIFIKLTFIYYYLSKNKKPLTEAQPSLSSEVGGSLNRYFERNIWCAWPESNGQPTA